MLAAMEGHKSGAVEIYWFFVLLRRELDGRNELPIPGQQPDKTNLYRVNFSWLLHNPSRVEGCLGVVYVLTYTLCNTHSRKSQDKNNTECKFYDRKCKFPRSA